ncbi:putative transcriptional regulatory protein [Colletotrichum sp. SAR 10_65]|nr:putative transcriptional regulatory protein [Colletotrichum sp. SAR 10_65]KAI8183264.1 putative transcriptional regulatory protein [Colletotrichum sp. SAR 10_75]KAJ4995696.1 putative transcriptional regulatory protein [Colletotrichum sp. SAR 10_66]
MYLHRQAEAAREEDPDSLDFTIVRFAEAYLQIRKHADATFVTPSSEKKIDQIDRRLEQVVGLLQTLPLNAEQTSHESLQSLSGSQETLPTNAGFETSSVMEGESSLAAQFTFADDFMQKVARGESPSLYPHARIVHRPSYQGSELPPIQETVKVIRIAESQRLAGTGWIYEYLPLHQFSKTCLEVYFSEQYSEADFIIVTAGLHSIFKDYSSIVPEEERERPLKSLLFAPFVPYIVMFCRVIETQDKADLARLGDFSASIQIAAQVSEAAFKAYHLFHTLHDIAVRYLELCAAHPQNGQNRAGPEMDWFLEALGIAPPGQENDGQRHLASDAPWFGTDLIDSVGAEGARSNDATQRRRSATQPLARVGNEVELESWLQNNEAVMEFLRETEFSFGDNP